MSPVPVVTQMPVSTGSTNLTSGTSCSSSFINHANYDHLDLLNPYELKNANENSFLNNNRHSLGINDMSDMGCFDAGSMLFSSNYNSSSSNSSMMSNESINNANSNGNNNNHGVNYTNVSHNKTSDNDLFDSFSLDKFSNTFSTNSFFDVDLFQYGDSCTNYNNTNAMGSSFSKGFLAFEDLDDESDSLDEEDLIMPHVLDQELARAIDNSEENDSESDHLLNDSIALVAAANNEALCAIREIAIREKRQQQRKHKNSTSSISSMSMSSTIKKVSHRFLKLIKKN
jgi:hypothetical protein